MGDVIDKLPVDDTLAYTQKDVAFLNRFFDTGIAKPHSSSSSSPPRDGNAPSVLVAMMLSALFFVFIHPSGPARYIFPVEFRPIGLTILFGIAVSVCMHLHYRWRVARQNAL